MSEHGHEPTGSPAVDEVVESLERLEGAPVAEHVPVFENAHEKLREALTGAGDTALPQDPPTATAPPESAG